MAFIFEHERKGINYNGHYIQTYSFGTGDNIVFSFPSFPHSGIYYLWFLNHHKDKNIRFITFDLPGWIGYSENFLQDGFLIQEFVEIAKQILREYKVEKFNIIGYSFGGALGIRLAAELSDRVKKIVIVSAIINGTIIKNRTARLIKLARRLKMYSRVSKTIQRRFKALTKTLIGKEFSLDTFNLYSDMLAHLDPKTITESAYQLFTLDWTEYLLNIKDKEILIINSFDEEPMFKQQAKYMRTLLKEKESYYINGSHDDFILKPSKECVQKVIEFLIN